MVEKYLRMDFFPLRMDTKTHRLTRAVCTDMIRTTSVTPVGQHCYSWLRTTDWAKGRPMTELRWCQRVLGVMCLTTGSVKVIRSSTNRRDATRLMLCFHKWSTWSVLMSTSGETVQMCWILRSLWESLLIRSALTCGFISINGKVNSGFTWGHTNHIFSPLIFILMPSIRAVTNTIMIQHFLSNLESITLYRSGSQCFISVPLQPCQMSLSMPLSTPYVM